MFDPAYVREHMKVPASVTDPVLQDVIDRAVGRMRDYCRWHVFPAQEATATLDGNGAESLLLPSLHVVDVLSVTVAGRLLTSDQFEWSNKGYLRRTRRQSFPDSLRAVQVRFSHGYDIDDIDGVRDVLLSMVERVVTLPHFIKSSSAGEASVTYGVDAALRPTFGDKEVLDEYRITLK